MPDKKNISISEIFPDIGSPHPIIEMKSKLLDILRNIGFRHFEGPEIESEENNFDMLNIQKNHPARQMHDTFYILKKSFVLRTHTSPVQVRCMKEMQPPIAISSAGKVFRKDDDSTHLPMFHQVEAIYVGENVTFSNLKSVINKILLDLFGENTQSRFRPSYFPFTEPSAEVDILSDQNKWLEILGCGIVNPKVLENCNIDSKKYSGFALGLGVERIAMLKNNVSDIRDFYKSNLDFLEQLK